jgi:RNA polymerase sporulation-specific sigma factor
MNTLFESVTVTNVLDDEPIFERQPFENLKTTQLMTCEEAEKIIKSNLGIVHNLANRYAYGRNDHDEITSVAYMGYVKAINGFDPERLVNGKPVKFVTFAYRCITNEILFYLRNENKETEKVIPMNTMISTDKNGNELELEDILADETDMAEECAMKDTVRIMMNIVETYLTDEEKFIIMSRFGIQCKQLTQSQIAEMIDMSQANISKKEKSIIQKIKIIMTSKYGDSIGY